MGYKEWRLSDIKQDKDVTVFTTFSCGGGSSMGYKRAGFKVLGNVEIDPKINAMYVKNNSPQYNYCMDLRDFNKLEDLPEELYHLDILDGSPPCTTFSVAGLREEVWGKAKVFREGQTKQTLDDLFFVFLDTVEKLKPKIVVAENVEGLLKGNAKGFVHDIVERFKALGYEVQIFKLNSAVMDVPQSRRRVFFVANNQRFKKLRLNFNSEPISFGEVRSPEGKPIVKKDSVLQKCAKKANKTDKSLKHTIIRMCGKQGTYYNDLIVGDDQICLTLTANGSHYRKCDALLFTDEDFRRCSSFPEDYDFCGRNVQYVCGMSVPPNMMMNVAKEIYDQWLK